MPDINAFVFDLDGTLVQDPTVLREHRWPHALSLLDRAREHRCAVGLATTSRRRQACYVLNVLGLEDAFDVVATADEVVRTKPHPEIYRLCAVELGVPPERMLAVEDSPTGARAALNAGPALRRRRHPVYGGPASGRGAPGRPVDRGRPVGAPRHRRRPARRRPRVGGVLPVNGRVAAAGRHGDFTSGPGAAIPSPLSFSRIVLPNPPLLPCNSE